MAIGDGMASSQHPDTGQRRWTIHVCPGCGSYASEYDLEPRFGNIVVHDDLTEACMDAAEVVEVISAATAERLADLLRELHEWDMMSGDGDGAWWRARIRAALASFEETRP